MTHYFNNTPQGWQCPVCGKVHAPFIPSCDCHKRTADVVPHTNTGGTAGNPVPPYTTTNAGEIERRGNV